MSALFGKWNFDGGPVDPAYLEQVESMLVPYGPDSHGCYRQGGIALLHHALQVTPESRGESQPLVTPSGSVVLWDGRLDNRDELLDRLGARLAPDAADGGIVAAAWARWGDRCLPQLIGDWALSIWNPREQCLILAKDFLGTRPLYYAITERDISWSTALDPLVFCGGRSFAVQEEYLAGWLLQSPEAHLTPFVGLHAVPPASWVLVRAGRSTVRKYWDFNPEKKTLCRTDADYEEEFRARLRQSVRRRLRSSTPVLAELSGGMDSSSIACIADRILACGLGEAPRLDTLSYFDDSEPNWNERPYVAQVEARRGRAGCHINVPADSMSLLARVCGVTSNPGTSLCASAAAEEFATCLSQNGIRVVLSGIGGDEVLGGVPDPIPELADLLRTGRLRTWSAEMAAWALALRKPLFALLAETVKAFLPNRRANGAARSSRPIWVRSDCLARNAAGPQRFTLRGPLPSFQDSLHTLAALRRQLGCAPAACRPPYEKRYPYLDRDLLEFLFAVPPEQLLRPNRRRHLMRRSLAGIVPEEILNRRRKAYVVRRPTLDLLREAPALMARIREMPEALLQIVDPDVLKKALDGISQSQAAPLIPLIRIFALDTWLRNLANSGTWNGQIAANGAAMPRVEAVAGVNRLSPAEDQSTAERR